jgi:hypothetical protein
MSTSDTTAISKCVQEGYIQEGYRGKDTDVMMSMTVYYATVTVSHVIMSMTVSI